MRKLLQFAYCISILFFLSFNCNAQNNDPRNNRNLVDNSQKILECKKHIQELKQSKANCYTCNGTGSIKRNCLYCSGIGHHGYGKYYRLCSLCNGAGKRSENCPNCVRINMTIFANELLLKEYIKTHGMTEETRELYYNQINNNYQNSTNDIVESDTKCYVCKGTGREKRPITSVTSSSDYKKVCPECNEVMPSYDLHIHQTCTGCKGKGYY